MKAARPPPNAQTGRHAHPGLRQGRARGGGGGVRTKGPPTRLKTQGSVRQVHVISELPRPWPCPSFGAHAAPLDCMAQRPQSHPTALSNARHTPGAFSPVAGAQEGPPRPPHQGPGGMPVCLGEGEGMAVRGTSVVSRGMGPSDSTGPKSCCPGQRAPPLWRSRRHGAGGGCGAGQGGTCQRLRGHSGSEERSGFGFEGR